VTRVATLWCGLIIAICCTLVAQSDPSFWVPAGDAPIVDGRLDDGEWDDALALSLGEDVVLFAKHVDGFLYLGVRGQTRSQIVGNVHIARGDEVRILHASHALGSAVYVRDGEAWRLSRPFVWKCRALGFADSAVEQRSAFLEEQGWLASVVRLGLSENMEYQIAIEGEPMRILFRFDVHEMTTTVFTWPLAIEIGLEPGPLPPTAGFLPKLWSTVTFGPET